MKIVVEVKIEYRDEKIEMFECLDSPYVGSDFITLSPYGKPMGRVMIPKEGVARMEWDYLVKKR